MTKHLSTSQHQMLEDLTGLQHTRCGQVRKKQNRSSSETRRLGLISQHQRKLQREPEPDPSDPAYRFKMLLRKVVS